MTSKTPEMQTPSRWEPVKRMMAGASPVRLSSTVARMAEQAPGQWLARLSLYKFAAKMIGPEANVLDVDCGQGLGTWILAKECGAACGIDPDAQAIELARRNWNEDHISFKQAKLPLLEPRAFDAVVVFNHRVSSGRITEWQSLIEAVAARLKPHGVAILTGPSLQNSNDACFIVCQQVFSQTFLFSVFGELIRPGRHRGADHTLLLNCR